MSMFNQDYYEQLKKRRFDNAIAEMELLFKSIKTTVKDGEPVTVEDASAAVKMFADKMNALIDEDASSEEDTSEETDDYEDEERYKSW